MTESLILGIILIIFVLISAFIEIKQGIYYKTKKGLEKINVPISLKNNLRYIIYAVALISIYFIYQNSSDIMKKIFRIAEHIVILVILYNMCRSLVNMIILNDFSEIGKEWKEYYASRNIFKKIMIKIFRINFKYIFL